MTVFDNAREVPFIKCGKHAVGMSRSLARACTKYLQKAGKSVAVNLLLPTVAARENLVIHNLAGMEECIAIADEADAGILEAVPFALSYTDLDANAEYLTRCTRTA
jgi:hypothetical protein